MLENHVVKTAPISPLPQLATVNALPACFPMAGLTPAKIRSDIFKSEDRIDSKGRTIQGNGLAATGAIVRRKGSRRVLINVPIYGNWLAGEGGGCAD